MSVANFRDFCSVDGNKGIKGRYFRDGKGPSENKVLLWRYFGTCAVKSSFFRGGVRNRDKIYRYFPPRLEKHPNNAPKVRYLLAFYVCTQGVSMCPE
ncbi:hypothetical protein [Paenibacillus sp. TH7-28]